MKSLLTSLLATLAVGLVAIAPPVLAKTPDGQTPAEETVCADETGALKGLCNAYCEAMDCNLDEGIHASPKACAKVLENYHRKSDGIDPPCLLPGCAETATIRADNAYYKCLENPKCKTVLCRNRAQDTYKLTFQACEKSCGLKCRSENRQCVSEAKWTLEQCVMDADGKPAKLDKCNTEAKAAISACDEAQTSCTTSCLHENPGYVPPPEMCRK